MAAVLFACLCILRNEFFVATYVPFLPCGSRKKFPAIILGFVIDLDTRQRKREIERRSLCDSTNKSSHQPLLYEHVMYRAYVYKTNKHAVHVRLFTGEDRKKKCESKEGWVE